jgi:four helix bundle protein
MDRHRDLQVWQLSRKLVGAVYRLTRELPDEERYVVIPQLRRAAWSVSSNIAEGNAKLGRRELRRYLDSAIGSLAEIDSMVATLPDVHSIAPVLCDEVDHLRRDTARAIYGLLRSPGR